MTIFNAIYRCLHHRLGRDPEQASKAIFVAARGYEKRKMTKAESIDQGGKHERDSQIAAMKPRKLLRWSICMLSNHCMQIQAPSKCRSMSIHDC